MTGSRRRAIARVRTEGPRLGARGSEFFGSERLKVPEPTTFAYPREAFSRSESEVASAEERERIMRSESALDAAIQAR